MSHYNIFCIGSVLDAKRMVIDMARWPSSNMVVHHIDSGHVVFIERSGTELRISDFRKDSTKIFCCNSSKKLSFCAGSSSSGLSFRARK